MNWQGIKYLSLDESYACQEARNVLDFFKAHSWWKNIKFLNTKWENCRIFLFSCNGHFVSQKPTKAESQNADSSITYKCILVKSDGLCNIFIWMTTNYENWQKYMHKFWWIAICKCKAFIFYNVYSANPYMWKMLESLAKFCVILQYQK